MRKVVLAYGTISGGICAAMFFITHPLYMNNVITSENSVIIGFATMILALSLIFFGIKSFRDNQRGGVISFGKAFQVGILIAVVASQEKIDAAKKEMENMKAMYENILFRFGMTLMEIFPVGLLITLICAGVLRKKEILPI